MYKFTVFIGSDSVLEFQSLESFTLFKKKDTSDLSEIYRRPTTPGSDNSWQSLYSVPGNYQPAIWADAGYRPTGDDLEKLYPDKAPVLENGIYYSLNYSKQLLRRINGKWYELVYDTDNLPVWELRSHTDVSLGVHVVKIPRVGDRKPTDLEYNNGVVNSPFKSPWDAKAEVVKEQHEPFKVTTISQVVDKEIPAGSTVLGVSQPWQNK